MSAALKKISAKTWAIISAIGCILFLVALYFFISFSNELSLLTPGAYYFLLILIALLASAFLGSSLKSRAKYKGKAYGSAIDLGGPVIIFAIILYIGYKYSPLPAPFTLTVNVYGSADKTKPLKKGLVTLSFNSYHTRKEINTHGKVTFAQLPVEKKGSTVSIIASSINYISKDSTYTIPLSDEPVINIHLQRKPHSKQAR